MSSCTVLVHCKPGSCETEIPSSAPPSEVHLLIPVVNLMLGNGKRKAFSYFRQPHDCVNLANFSSFPLPQAEGRWLHPLLLNVLNRCIMHMYTRTINYTDYMLFKKVLVCYKYLYIVLILTGAATCIPYSAQWTQLDSPASNTGQRELPINSVLPSTTKQTSKN